MSSRVRRIAVYPRVCGGTYCTFSIRPAGSGLSPRVRGNPALLVRLRILRRSIPACAGEPPATDGRAGIAEVYPRVCGGTHRHIPHCAADPGLSPRVRGNLGVPDAALLEWRSIPACAGEPGWHRRGYMYYKVYPRVCGGTAITESLYNADDGLSPRVRGNRGLPVPK